MRCLSLAHALREDGAACTFACQPQAGDLRAEISRAGFDVIEVSDPAAATLAGALQQAGLRPDWLIVDHYRLNHEWESAMRSHAGRILSIDDPPVRPHDCDVLLNPTTTTTAAAAAPVHSDSIVLGGVEYALLRREYRELRKQAIPRSGSVRRILITFGGGDRYGMTLSALRAVLAATGADVAVDVAIASSIPDRAAIESAAAGSSRTTLHVDAPTLAPLILAADLGIGAAGSTSWERLCLGLPSIVMTIAPNQEALAEALDARGLAIWIGSAAEAATRLPSAIASVVREGIDEEWSRRGLRFVDGKGAARAAAVLTASASTAVRARAAEAADESRLLRWANDPVTRRDSFSQQSITPAEHHQWYTRVLNDAATRQFIVETASGAEIGQVRFQRRDRDWEVHYTVAPEFRARNLGRKLLRAGLDAFRLECPDRVFARVKTSNPASQKICRALGFTVADADAETITYMHAP